MNAKVESYSDRGLLSFSRLEEFATWAQSKGYTREPTKGDFEVLRLRYPDEKPVIIYAKSSATEHLTVMGRDHKMVRAFIRETRAGYTVTKDQAGAEK